jgi:hypothetical protein
VLRFGNLGRQSERWTYRGRREERSSPGTNCPEILPECLFKLISQLAGVNWAFRGRVVTPPCKHGRMGFDVVAEVRSAIDGLIEAGRGALGDSKTVCDLHREFNRFNAVMSGAEHEFDLWGGFTQDGAHSSVGWLTTACHLPKGEARRRIRRAKALTHLPLAHAAREEGVLTSAAFDALIARRRPATEAAMERDEELLVKWATELTHADFMRALQYWEQLADPNGTEEKGRDQFDRRSMWLVPSLDGMYLGKMTMDPISGSIVAGELDRIEHELFEEDYAEAKERLGIESPTMAQLKRTANQRRVDAMVEMARRSLGAKSTDRRPEPLFTVHVDYETLAGRMCQLANGVAIAPGQVVPWFPYALVERAIFGPDGRVEVSKTARFYTGATRRGLEVRDLECQHDYCDVPYEHCEGDHIQPYSEGGQTTQENGQMLCGFHNRLRNQRPPPDD